MLVGLERTVDTIIPMYSIYSVYKVCDKSKREQIVTSCILVFELFCCGWSGS